MSVEADGFSLEDSTSWNPIPIAISGSTTVVSPWTPVARSKTSTPIKSVYVVAETCSLSVHAPSARPEVSRLLANAFSKTV